MSVRHLCRLCSRSCLLRNVGKSERFYSSRSQLTNAEVRRKRNTLFEEEQNQQFSRIKRIEKIRVDHVGVPEECSLIMNKGLSTPYNCAMHIGELLMKRSLLALVNGKPWDMHRPLTEDCQLEFCHALDEDPALANLTFWRTCSFVLGHIMETAFKEKHYIELCSGQPADIQSGSFVYDVDLKIPDWTPSQIELNCLSREGSKLRFKEHKLERLDVDASVAENMFEDNRYKLRQIPEVAAASDSGNTVTVYRMGDHIDISPGPLISNTAQIGRFNVTAIHPVDSPEHGQVSRVQGVAMVTDIQMHWSTYEFLQKRAARLNTSGLSSASSRGARKAQQKQSQNS